MKPHLLLGSALALLLASASAEEADPSLAGLEETAASFVTAFNRQDAAALAALFTEEGELCDAEGADLTSGREQIKAHYAGIFDDEDPVSLALEVRSVRLVAPNLAIEDGTAHFTPADAEGNPAPVSNTYTAVLMKNSEGKWRIASSRRLQDVTSPAGHLAELEKVIKGDWTTTRDGVRVDLAFGWDPSGRFLTGEMLTTTADGDPQSGSVRIAWDGARKSIVSWIFDAEGGASFGVWTPDDAGWDIRSEGTTADGETMTASQELVPDGNNTLLWTVTGKVIDGEKQPDGVLRLVRQAPEPAAPANP